MHHGSRITPTENANNVSVWSSTIGKIFGKLTNKQSKPAVAELVMSELQHLGQSYREEKLRFQFEFTTEKEKSKRLLYLFQKDLMPGISGQILESKDRRDELVIKGVSRSAKWLAWIVITLMNVAMLFYIFLFAVSQESHRQRAWAQSFGLWLVVEVIIVSSAIVFFMHVLVPSLVMNDVSKIRKRLIGSLQEYHKKMSARSRQQSASANTITKQRDRSLNDNQEDSDSEGEKQRLLEDPSQFNAARYLFLSTKTARMYPELKIAQIIREFSTPWPKQSYHRATDLTKSYNKKFQAITKSIKMIVMFFVTSFISIPPSIQDMAIHMGTTIVSGYTALIHIQLYHIYPVLVVIPTLLLAAILHFIVQSNKVQSKLEFARLFGNNGQESTVVEDEDDKNLKTIAPRKGLMKPPADADDNSSVVTINRHRDRRQSVAHGISIAKKASQALRARHSQHSEESLESDDFEVSSSDGDESHDDHGSTSNSENLARQLARIVKDAEDSSCVASDSMIFSAMVKNDSSSSDGLEEESEEVDDEEEEEVASEDEQLGTADNESLGEGEREMWPTISVKEINFDNVFEFQMPDEQKDDDGEEEDESYFSNLHQHREEFPINFFSDQRQ
jgi:uncharacterized membrane protein